ncbi:MAG: response regulator transcription factor [Sarcina sp.]
MRNILLIEDDLALNKGLTFKLKKEGYNVLSTAFVSEARKAFFENKIDLIICDINLADGNGFELCEEIRKKSDVYIIFLTAEDDEVSIVNGYDLGADDYITKPFSLMVLISKVNCIMKRIDKKNIVFSELISGELVYLINEMKLFKKQELQLSKNEIKMINFFLNNPKQIITKEQILRELWDIDENFIDENTIAVNIRRLRQKIEKTPSEPEYIKNIRGIGYIWNMEVVKK